MLDKEAFIFRDRLIKGITTDRNFKISVVKTTDVIKTARSNHNLSLLSTVLLGRAMNGAMLMASELKGEERINLTLEGNGPVGKVVAEANSVGEIRGYVKNPQARLDFTSDEHIGEGLGIGLLTFSKTLYNESKPRTSVIQLQSGNVTQDLAHYLVQSEQVPSALLLDVGIDDKGEITQAGGVLIQKLPGAPDADIKYLQQHLKEFESVNKLLESNYYIDEIMEMASGKFEVRELTRYPVDFFCRCSKDRFKDALALINPDELTDMEDEGQELVCHYCNSHYQVSQQEIAEIAEQARAKMN